MYLREILHPGVGSHFWEWASILYGFYTPGGPSICLTKLSCPCVELGQRPRISKLQNPRERAST